MKSLDGRVAAITGAGSGIGRGLALALAAEGCHLALADLNATGLEETAALAGALGVSVTTTTLDVSDEAAMYAWAEDVVAQHGAVNLIFNNAGGGVVRHRRGAQPRGLPLDHEHQLLGGGLRHQGVHAPPRGLR